jgi:hypothetical protein
MALIWKSVSRIFMHFSELFFYQEEINLAKLIIINYNDTFFFSLSASVHRKTVISQFL